MSALTCAIASDDDVDAADAQNIEKRKGGARKRPQAPKGG